MKKVFEVLLLLMFMVTLCSACGSDKDTTAAAAEEARREVTGTYVDYVDAEMIIGVQSGSIYNLVAQDVFRAKVIPEFVVMSDLLETLRMGRLDAALSDSSYVTPLQDSGVFPEFEYLWVSEESFANHSAPVFHEEELKKKYNEWIGLIKADGTLERMTNFWLGMSLPEQEELPKFELTGENGTLRVADTGMFPPFIYLDANGDPTGFDYELINLFAMHLGMDLDLTFMSYDAIIPYVISGRANMSACLFTITEERGANVIFGAPTVTTLAVLIVPSDTISNDASAHATIEFGDFREWLSTAIERNLITDNRWRLITDGLLVTMTIAVCSQFFGTIFGFFICWVLTRKNKFVNWLGRTYCRLINGLPIVALLMITYYIIFGSTQISSIIIAISAFTMVMGANVAQILKGAIDTIDLIEIEAARSMGFTPLKAFLTITLPQVIRRALPSYSHGFVELVKATAIVGYVAIQDMMRAADIIRSRTFDAYFPLLLVSLIYLVITTICVYVLGFIVKKIDGGTK
ncbi:MAG: ABC transporter permease subunit [Lachnospiraceae bacterium]|jgi:polar amino acid transport system substrate-binding protein|nr:ABC transporter permease subunit [Lachnospiraceae bacterium]